MPTQCSPLRQETRRQGRGHRPGEPISRPDILIQSITAKRQVLKPPWRSIYACAWVVLNQYQLLTGNNTFLQLWTPRTGWGLPPNLSELDSSHRSLFTCTAWWSSTWFSYVSLTNQPSVSPCICFTRTKQSPNNKMPERLSLRATITHCCGFL